MHMQTVRERAKSMGIRAGRASKLMLIRQIQTSEGNFPCFATAYESDCDQVNCAWREDCFSSARKQIRNC
jgi:hypothetical protein